MSEHKKNVYFKDVSDLIAHLQDTFGELTPLKLQKSLYFLFAIYAGFYNGSEDSSYDMPEFLFDEDFEAWTYGPVIPEVYHKNKNDGYETKRFDFGDSMVDKEVEKFIDDVGKQIMDKSDFALVDRSHEDEAWKEAHGKFDNEMNKEAIVREYRQRIKQS